MNILQTLDSKVDLVEICGGAARTSTVCIRKQLQVGRNFDLITQCDLNDPSQQQMVTQYFCDHKPLVAVMAPRCSANSSLNHQTHHAGWEETYQNSVPHDQFCGELALLQIEIIAISFLNNLKEAHCTRNIPGTLFVPSHPYNISQSISVC